MKKDRQEKIIEIIRRHDVGTQEELAELLNSEGFPATQATISRDIRELKLSKMPAEAGVQRYVLPEQGAGPVNRYVRVLKEAYTSGEAVQNILVVRTVSGMAMAVAAALDALKFPEIVGSIAGDDTIFVAVHTAEETKALADRIHSLLA